MKVLGIKKYFIFFYRKKMNYLKNIMWMCNENINRENFYIFFFIIVWVYIY